MLFSSMSFIFVFLPIVLIAYYICKNRESRNTVLLIASIIFYAWGEPKYLLIMFITILTTWASAILLTRFSYKKIIFSLALFIDFGILIYFKYTNFLLENFSKLFTIHFDPINIIMPIGISFYTFQAVSYLIDVYTGKEDAQQDVYKLMLYITLFPQLVAGPIVKYHDIRKQLDVRTENLSDFHCGVRRFIIGLSKKMLIANTMGAVADKIFILPIDELDCLTSWVGAIAYTFQIYYDFSGYSDMAIGLCLMFGIHLPENFNYPYISSSITEFWRRWHISLSTWFKEYLYIPLGGNRVSKGRNLLNLFIVFLTTGIWHGASWNFVIWGLWHGFFIIFEKLTGIHKETKRKLLILTYRFVTLLAVVVGWVFFRTDNLSYACDYVLNMFGFINFTGPEVNMYYFVDRLSLITFAVALGFMFPIAKNVPKVNRLIPACIIDVGLITLFLCSWATIAASTYNPFIYFRF